MEGRKVNGEQLSVRQLSVAAFTGGLAPAAAGAGYGWQGALLALPVLVLAGWAMAVLAKNRREADLGWPGTVLKVLYALWGTALFARGIGLSARRVLLTGGGDLSAAPWLMILLAVLLAWIARGKPAAVFRAAEIFYLAVGASAAALLVWGAFRMKWEYVLLPGASVWDGFWSALGAGGLFLFVLPYINNTRPARGDMRRAVGWLTALGCASALMALVTAGVLSPALAAEAEHPFFLMTAALGRTARVEGLACAIWLLADVTFLSLLARSWQGGKMGTSWLPVTGVVLGTAAGCLGVTEKVPGLVWPVGTVILGALTAAVLLGAGKNSGRKEG